MTDENPYAAVADLEAPKNRRWLHRLVILNALLIGLPIMLAISVWMLLAMNGVRISGSSGSLGTVTLIFAVGYFVLPNLIMIVAWRLGNRAGVDVSREAI